MKNRLKRWVAMSLLTVGYGLALVVSRLLGPPRPLSAGRRRGKILVIGTLHNLNWFLAHLEPLALTRQFDLPVVRGGRRPLQPRGRHTALRRHVSRHADRRLI